MTVQFRSPRVTFLGVLLLVADAQPSRLGAGAGPGYEPAEGQCGVRRVAEPFGDNDCPLTQFVRTVHWDWGGRVHNPGGELRAGSGCKPIGGAAKSDDYSATAPTHRSMIADPSCVQFSRARDAGSIAR